MSAQRAWPILHNGRLHGVRSAGGDGAGPARPAHGREQHDLTTYFVRQPETPEEVEQARSAIVVCCVKDLRYGGLDRTIIKQLGNDPEICDYLIRGNHLVLSDQAGDAEPGAAPPSV